MKYLIIMVVALTLTGSKLLAMQNENSCIASTEDKLCIQLEWKNGPYLNAYSQNIVRFVDLKSSQTNQKLYRTPKGSIQFYSWMIMNGHQHGGRPVETEKLEDGVYLNSKIYYMGGMMGSWQFKLKINETEFILDNLDIQK